MHLYNYDVKSRLKSIEHLLNITRLYTNDNKHVKEKLLRLFKE